MRQISRQSWVVNLPAMASANILANQELRSGCQQPLHHLCRRSKEIQKKHLFLSATWSTRPLGIAGLWRGETWNCLPSFGRSRIDAIFPGGELESPNFKLVSNSVHTGLDRWRPSQDNRSPLPKRATTKSVESGSGDRKLPTMGRQGS